MTMKLCVLFILWFLGGLVATEEDTRRNNDGIADDTQDNAETETEAQNQRLLSSIPQPYEIVYPIRLKGNVRVPVSTWLVRGRKIVHVDDAVFSFDVFGRKQKIQVNRVSHLLSRDVRRKYDSEDGGSIISESVVHCYYQGHVVGHVGSRVALSTCDGLNGVVEFDNVTFVIKPLRSVTLGNNRPHVLYPAVNVQQKTCGVVEARWPSFKNVHREEYARRLKQASLESRTSRTAGLPQWRVIEMALMIDHHMFASRNISEDLTVIDDILLVVNIADMYYKWLHVNLTVVHVETWQKEDKINLNQSMKKVLQDFISYKEKATYNLQHDNTQLFSALPTLDRDTGLAIPESICTYRSIAINKIKNVYQPLDQATVLVHMIAHNLGLSHDTDYCQCSGKKDCLLNNVIVGRGDQHTKGFSNCSVEAFKRLVSVGLADCLLPGQQETSYQSVCGNGIVERGEQCDCISLEDCLSNDPCCDPRTCLLYSWAQCNNGPCCNNCTFERKKMCRPSSNECDVPEFCPGDSGQCPENDRAQDGSSCSMGRGYCYTGRCATHQSQCREIWGKAATMADRACYNRFNLLGSTNGHCGANATTHLYDKCEKRNVFCGLLHCIGGESVPGIGAQDTYTKMIVSEKSYEYQCNILNTISIPEFPQYGVVRDGTKCGEQSVCINHQCVHLDTVRTGTCPTNDPQFTCSGHGVCTNKLRCYCTPFWTGADCADVMPIPTRKSEPVVYRPIITYTDAKNRTHIIRPPDNSKSETKVVEKADEESISTRTLMIILGAVAGAVMIFLILLMLCYRRQSPSGYHSPYSPPWVKKKLHHPAPRSLSSDEGVQSPRIIKFGSMPSYREEKYRELRDRVLRIKQGLLDPNATDTESHCEENKRSSRLSQDSQILNLAKKPKRGILKNTEKKDSGSEYDNTESAERVARIQSLDDLIKKIEEQVLAPESGAGEARCDFKLDNEIQNDLERTLSAEELKEGKMPEFPGPLINAKLSIYVPMPLDGATGPAERPVDIAGVTDAQTGLNKDLKVSPLSPPLNVEKRPKKKNKKRVTSSGSETSDNSSEKGSQRKVKRKPKSSQTESEMLTVELPVLQEVSQPEMEMKEFRPEVKEFKPEVKEFKPEVKEFKPEASELESVKRKSRADFKPNILPLTPSKDSKSPLYQKKFSPSTNPLAVPPSGFQRAPSESAMRVNLAEEEDLDYNDLSPESNVLDSFSSDTSPNEPPSRMPPFKQNRNR